MEWLHPGCDSHLSADFRKFGASNFPFKIPFKKCFKIVFFLLWRRDPSGFGAAISDAVALSSIVICNSVSADRIGVAASRLLAAAAACVILLSFAAEDCKSYWSGCIQAAIMICQQIFAILALVIFLLKSLLKSASKSSFFCFGVEIHPVLELLSCVEKFVCKRLPCVKALCASTVCKCSVSKRLLCVKACCV